MINKPKPPYDITFCVNRDCELSKKCKRSTQHYDFKGCICSQSDFEQCGDPCEYFWRIESK